MGLLKNSYFLDLLQEQEERDRMELARREQAFINSRKAHQQQPAKATTQKQPKGTK